VGTKPFGKNGQKIQALAVFKAAKTEMATRKYERRGIVMVCWVDA
jgi:hypothetical protein